MIVLLAALAWADEPEVETDRAVALELFDSGSSLYAEGAYEASVAAFEEAMALSGERSLNFNIANAHERAGQLEEAHRALVAYREVAPSDDFTTLDRRVASLQQRIDAIVTPEPIVLAPPPDLPPPPRRHPRWTVVGAGVGVAAGGVALAGITTGQAKVSFVDDNREAYDRQRTLNQVSWTGVGLGAGLTVVGLVLQTRHPSPQGLAFTF